MSSKHFPAPATFSREQWSDILWTVANAPTGDRTLRALEALAGAGITAESLKEQPEPVIAPEDIQTCPRRMGDFGPWEHEANLDSWERRDLALGHNTRYCSFCGGLHPDDAVALILDGAHIEGTTKGYKKYLHHPALKHTNGTAKVYVMHLSKPQCEAWNAAVKKMKFEVPPTAR